MKRQHALGFYAYSPWEMQNFSNLWKFLIFCLLGGRGRGTVVITKVEESFDRPVLGVH